MKHEAISTGSRRQSIHPELDRGGAPHQRHCRPGVVVFSHCQTFYRAGLVLVLAIMQLPPILVIGPVIFYVFGTSGLGTAIAFAVYGILVSASDAILKPLFLGCGVEVPMPVILLGAIGGMILSGIVGLFLGAVVLALGYQLTLAWLHRAPEIAGEATTPPVENPEQ